MSGLPTRYVPHLALLCTLALVPVAVHSYLDLRTDECADPEAFAPERSGGARPADQGAFMLRHFDSTAWREGRLRAGARGSELRFALVRSLDPKLVYHRPENVFLSGETPSSHRIDWTETPGGQRLPVHRALYAPSRSRRTHGFAAWILLYDGRPVANPVVAQLRAAPGLAFVGRAPMTLAMVWGQIAPGEQSRAEASANERLVRGFEEYRAVCLGEPEVG